MAEAIKTREELAVALTTSLKPYMQSDQAATDRAIQIANAFFALSPGNFSVEPEVLAQRTQMAWRDSQKAGIFGGHHLEMGMLRLLVECMPAQQKEALHNKARNVIFNKVKASVFFEGADSPEFKALYNVLGSNQPTEYEAALRVESDPIIGLQSIARAAIWPIYKEKIENKAATLGYWGLREATTMLQQIVPEHAQCSLPKNRIFMLQLLAESDMSLKSHPLRNEPIGTTLPMLKILAATIKYPDSVKRKDLMQNVEQKIADTILAQSKSLTDTLPKPCFDSTQLKPVVAMNLARVMGEGNKRYYKEALKPEVLDREAIDHATRPWWMKLEDGAKKLRNRLRDRFRKTTEENSEAEFEPELPAELQKTIEDIQKTDKEITQLRDDLDQISTEVDNLPNPSTRTPMKNGNTKLGIIGTAVGGLLTLLGIATQQKQPEPDKDGKTPPPKSNFWPNVATFVGIVTLLGGGGYWMLQSRKQKQPQPALATPK